jgi:LysR family nod box-dependent transcriptional activator
MRLNQLDLNLLVTLDALLTECSITKAAERVHRSQPATSGALARLRDFFGDELLVRVGSEMQPTALGASLAGPVHDILLQIQTTVERGVEFSAKDSNRVFKIKLSDQSSTTFLAEAVRELSKIAPNIKIELFSPAGYPANDLEQGKIDFLLMPINALSESHPKEVFFSDKFVCVACEKNMEVEKDFTLDKYVSMKHVTVKFGERRSATQDQIVLEENYGIKIQPDVVTSTFNSIPEYIPDTDRIAIVYSRLAEKWVNYLPLKTVPLPEGLEIPPVPWALQWHQYRDHDPGIQWMKDFLVSVARKLS